MTLPVALGGHDIIGQAKTGTGKTLGFGVPLLQRVVAPSDEAFDHAAHAPASRRPSSSSRPASSPSRSPATSSGPASARGVRVLTVYGGRAYEPQIEALQRGVEVVVGTPGRLHRPGQAGAPRPRRTRAPSCSTRPTRCSTWASCPTSRRLLALTPAVAPDDALLGHHAGRGRRAGPPLHDPADPHPRHGRPGRRRRTRSRPIEQFVYRAHAMDKVEMLARILQAKGRGLTIIFSRTKRTAAKVADELADRGFAAARHPRRPRPGRPRAGAARVPQRQGRRPRRHRRRRPRHRRRGRHPRRQLPVPRGREDLPAPHRPHRPRRQHRHRGDLRRLGRPAALGA